MTARARSAWASLAVFAALFCVVSLAHATEPVVAPERSAAPAGSGAPASNGPASSSKLAMDAYSVLGMGSLPTNGWGEVVVDIHNSGRQQASGTIEVDSGRVPWSNTDGSTTQVSFQVAGRASVSVHVPLWVGSYEDPVVTVKDAKGKKLGERGLQRAPDNRTILVDTTKASALGAALRGVQLGLRFDAWGHGGGGSVNSEAHVEMAHFDSATGDVVLPTRMASYQRAAVVLLHSDELARLDAAEKQALTGYVLGGGTLALVVERPEDTRHPLVQTLVGSALEKTAASPALTNPIALPTRTSGGMGGSSRRKLPVAGDVPPDLKEGLTPYAGANLRPSAYGSSASYGLGEVHVLAFDPTDRPWVDAPWVHVRMLDMMRRAAERRAMVLLPNGGGNANATPIRRQLDPNEGARWAIIVSSLLLLLYSIGAGPLNFTLWARRGKPLRALATLALASAGTFGVIVVIGTTAKGCRGKARRLTVVEAGGGMSVGVARRFRGLFMPSAQTVTVPATQVDAVARTVGDRHVRDRLEVDRDGQRIVDVQVRPWQTLVVREEGYADIGSGVALIEKGPDETLIVNRTGRRLKGLLLYQPTVGTRMLDELDDGGSVSSKAFKAKRSVLRKSSYSGLKMQGFNAYLAERQLNDVSAGLGDIWNAVAQTVGRERDWFPSSVPVLMAEVEGGEAVKKDTGLGVDRDRVVIRVVGYGGRP